MRNPRKLIKEALADYSERIEDANNSLCRIIDSMTDDNTRPLPYANVELIETLKDIAYGLYEMHDRLIPEDQININMEFEG